MLSRVVGFVWRAALPVLAAGLAFVLSAGVVGGVAAQEVLTVYSVSPPDAAVINADGRLEVLPQSQANGALIVTVSAFQGRAEGGAIIATTHAGAYTTTINILGFCRVGGTGANGGCDAFGIGLDGPGNNVAVRRNKFVNMSLTTLRQFIASGADINEYATAGSNRDIAFFLTYLFADAGKTAHVSMMISAGVDVNTRAPTGGNTMLGRASDAGEDNPAFDIIFNLPGVNLNQPGNLNRTPLEQMALARANNTLQAGIPGFGVEIDTDYLIPRSRQMRLAGAVCSDNAAASPQFALCRPPQLRPQLPENAQKVFVIRSETLTEPGVIGVITTPAPIQ